MIGAGAAGLAAAQALIAEGKSVVVLEKEARLGEQWRRRHKNLRLNTHRSLSTLPGASFPAGTGAFPSREAVIEMFESFASLHALPIRFGAAAERIERDDEDWVVTAGATVLRATDLVVATGRDARPFTPEWPGMASFKGRVVHAADFGEAKDYAGSSVLVVGAGNSGIDVLNHLVKAPTGQLWLGVRGSVAILPKRIASVAVHRFSPLLARLPVRLADAVISTTQRLVFGDLTRHGLPRPVAGAASRLHSASVAIAADSGAVAGIRAGRIKVVPTVREFSGADVVLSDGSAIRPDVVIAATGYRTGLEPLLGHLGVLDAQGQPRFTGDESDPALPGLWFSNMRPDLRGCFTNARLQAREIAGKITRGR